MLTSLYHYTLQMSTLPCVSFRKTSPLSWLTHGEPTPMVSKSPFPTRSLLSRTTHEIRVSAAVVGGTDGRVVAVIEEDDFPVAVIEEAAEDAVEAEVAVIEEDALLVAVDEEVAGVAERRLSLSCVPAELFCSFFHI